MRMKLPQDWADVAWALAIWVGGLTIMVLGLGYIERSLSKPVQEPAKAYAEPASPEWHGELVQTGPYEFTVRESE